MFKTLIALVTATSLTVFAGPLAAAGDSVKSGAATGAGAATTETGASQSGKAASESSGYGSAQKGVIETQVQPSFEPNFERLDQNKDGQLDQDELNAYGATAAGQGTGQNTQTQTSQDDTAVMERYDTNRDGGLSPDEFEAGYEADQKSSGAQKDN